MGRKKTVSAPFTASKAAYLKDLRKQESQPNDPSDDVGAPVPDLSNPAPPSNSDDTVQSHTVTGQGRPTGRRIWQCSQLEELLIATCTSQPLLLRSAQASVCAHATYS